MAKFRKKPIVIDAFQWNGEYPLPNPLVCNWDNNPMTGSKVSVRTLEGWLDVSIGDWIIRGISGEFYPCRPDVFEKTYEPIEDYV